MLKISNNSLSMFDFRIKYLLHICTHVLFISICIAHLLIFKSLLLGTKDIAGIFISFILIFIVLFLFVYIVYLGEFLYIIENYIDQEIYYNEKLTGYEDLLKKYKDAYQKYIESKLKKDYFIFYKIIANRILLLLSIIGKPIISVIAFIFGIFIQPILSENHKIKSAIQNKTLEIIHILELLHKHYIQLYKIFFHSNYIYTHIIIVRIINVLFFIICLPAFIYSIIIRTYNDYKK